jgi:hypothetical protein
LCFYYGKLEKLGEKVTKRAIFSILFSGVILGVIAFLIGKITTKIK